MKKIKTVFKIDREAGSMATPIPVEESGWVIEGEGFATVKFDGSSVLIEDGKMFKRMDRKLQKKYQKIFKNNKNMELTLDMFKEPPEGWQPCEPEPDKKTGHWPGWAPVDENNPQDKWHIEALKSADNLVNGTYELVGPKVQGNLYDLSSHKLLRHGDVVVDDMPRTFEGIKKWLEGNVCEGVVFHHKDGRMAKIRRKDMFKLENSNWKEIKKNKSSFKIAFKKEIEQKNYWEKFVFLSKEDEGTIKKLLRVNNRTRVKTFIELLDKIKDSSLLYKKLYFIDEKEIDDSGIFNSKDIFQHSIGNIKYSKDVFSNIMIKAPHLLMNLKNVDKEFPQNIIKSSLVSELSNIFHFYSKKNKSINDLKNHLEALKIDDIYPILSDDASCFYKNNSLSLLESTIEFSESFSKNNNKEEEFYCHTYIKKLNQEQYDIFKELASLYKPIIKETKINDLLYILNHKLETNHLEDFIFSFSDEKEINKDNGFISSNVFMTNQNLSFDEKPAEIDVEKINLYQKLGFKIDLENSNFMLLLVNKAPEKLEELSKQDFDFKCSMNIMSLSYNLLREKPDSQSIVKLFKTMQANIANYNIDKQLNIKKNKNNVKIH